MKILKRTLIIVIAAAAAALTSCKQDETLQYNNLTMGNIVAGTFTSDQGNIFNVVEKNCTGNLESMKRAIILCDVLKKVEGTDNVYDIRLNQLAEVLAKKHVTKNEADADKDMSVEDPIAIQDMWISGGYINMYVIFEAKSLGTMQKHLVNLVLNEKESASGKYEFVLRHNSFGESLMYNATGVSLAGSYVSFPIAELIKENSADITVRYKWYKNAGDGWSSETQENSIQATYTKGGFEHVPATLISKISDKLN
jgi:hypothetical protein